MNATKQKPSAVTRADGAYRILVNGEWVDGKGAVRAVTDKYRLQPGAQITTADAAQVTQTVAAAHEANRLGLNASRSNANERPHQRSRQDP